MKNILLEVDEPRKHFFKVCYPLISNIAYFVRLGRMEELYVLYTSFVKAYKRLDVIMKLYDQSVITAFEGVETALNLYCPNDDRLNEIFVSA